MTRIPAVAVLAAVVLGACSEAELTKIVQVPTTVYDNKLKLSGKVCTSDPADMVYPLKVLFIIDTSQSMNVNDPQSTTEADPTKQTGRAKAIRDVVTKYIDISVKYSSTYCNTGISGCDKGSTKCTACGTSATCVGPDCCSATSGCKGVPSCPASTATNGTCAPICDVTKSGCGAGEKSCADCPNSGDQCIGGMCGKSRDPGVEFAIARFGSAKQILTTDADGNEGFTSDVKEIVTAIPQVSNGGSVTDYEGALTMAYSLLSKDMANGQKKNTAAMKLSKYIIIFLSDGQPDPQISDEDDWNSIPNSLVTDLIGTSGDTSVITEYNDSTRILRRVKEIVALKVLYKVGAVTLNTAYLAGDTPSWLQDEATGLLKNMAKIGGGTFRSFPNGESINFLHIDFSTLKRVFRMKNLIATNINAKPYAGTILTDSDGDGIDDETEVTQGMNPASSDTDGDGFSDTLESFYRASGWDALNPSDADCSLSANDADGDKILDDTDGDGLYDCEERFLGTSRLLIDSDGDGIPDGVEARFGTNPVADDYTDDLDFDGMVNGEEVRMHTDPRSDDSAHRSRVSYRYSIKKEGSGLETLSITCNRDSECPTKTGCKSGYCRCTSTDDCSTRTKCTATSDCSYTAEKCTSSACAGTWTCQDPSDSSMGSDKVCSAKKNVTCYTFTVENIALVTPKAVGTAKEDGWNQVDVYFGEVPFDNASDYGYFYKACVRARYEESNGYKLPASGSVSIPAMAWKDPAKFNQSYTAYQTDATGGRQSCGSSSKGALYCDVGDLCSDTSSQKCVASDCLCPDGKVGLCPSPTSTSSQ
jgi:hypothetical protein